NWGSWRWTHPSCRCASRSTSRRARRSLPGSRRSAHDLREPTGRLGQRRPGRPFSHLRVAGQGTLTTVPRPGYRKWPGRSSTHAATSPGNPALPRHIHSHAIVAATIGAENDVPLHLAQPSKSSPSSLASGPRSKNVLTTSTPGAQALTHGPWLVNHAGPLGPSAPTPITFSNEAGQVGRQAASLPAEATNTTRSRMISFESGSTVW